VNAIIRPVLMFFSCGCIVLTMGLFMIVVNGLALWLASWISVNLASGRLFLALSSSALCLSCCRYSFRITYRIRQNKHRG
jgi:uncharacterized membrane protein YvlD (DUF360 family)